MSWRVLHCPECASCARELQAQIAVKPQAARGGKFERGTSAKKNLDFPASYWLNDCWEFDEPKPSLEANAQDRNKGNKRNKVPGCSGCIGAEQKEQGSIRTRSLFVSFVMGTPAEVRAAQLSAD